MMSIYKTKPDCFIYVQRYFARSLNKRYTQVRQLAYGITDKLIVNNMQSCLNF